MNPFVGLRPFREEERHLFQGRELASAYVETKSAINTMTLLFARSGIGKSSFLTSRLIPELRGRHPVVYVNEWGRERAEAIVNEGLARLAAAPRIADPSGYLVLDQFEDVFKQEFDRRGLWDHLSDIVNSDQAETRIIVTMREEWLGAWEEVDSIIDVILKDLRRQNAYGLGEGFVEPGMLQLVCQRLWSEASRSAQRIDSSLYERLGGADKIIRDFVWRHLRDDSGENVFAADQRVLWAGLVRHLSVAQGVKATVTGDVLARKLIVNDLGMAGPAVAAGKGLAVLNYLRKSVEKRENPPERLQSWISDTLETGYKFGFLKRQEGYNVSDPSSRLYELSHDRLDDLFRAFSLEFEKWIARRIYLLWALLFIVFFIAPYFTYVLMSEGIVQALLLLIGIALGFALYVGLIWVIIKIFLFLGVFIYYPVVRQLIRGSIQGADLSRKSRLDAKA